jgi:hypothetical protein
VTISQSGVDGVKTLAANSAFISLSMADTSLDLSDVTVTAGAKALSLKGTAGNDVVVAEDAATFTARLLAGGTAAYTLGTGDDNWSGAASSLDVGGGANTVNGTVLGGPVLLTDTLAASKTTDGNNLFLGAATGAVTGGNANDTLIGIFSGANDLKAGNDSLTGVGGGTLVLGSGDDSFTSFSPSLQLALANLVGAAGGHTSVSGGSGKDNLHTSIGGDVLTGGTGNDVFTISGATFSPVFVGTGTTATNLGGISGTTTIGTGSTANAVSLGNVTLADFNVGVKDKLNIDLLGTYTTGTTLTANSQALSGTTTITTALAAARTEDGGVRVLNGQGELVIIPEGAAIGTTVALKIFTTTGTLPTTTVTGTGTGVTDTIGFLTWLYNTNVGGTAAGGIRASLANTTYVAFALTTTIGGAPDLVAYLVTANTANTGTVASGEVTAVTIASLTATDGVGAADIVLI